MKHSSLPPHSSSWNMDGASFHLFIFTWVLGMLPSLHMPFLYFTLWWRREGDIFEIYFPGSKFISSRKPWYILPFKVNISIFLVCSCIAWQVLSCIAIIIIIWCVSLSPGPSLYLIHHHSDVAFSAGHTFAVQDYAATGLLNWILLLCFELEYSVNNKIPSVLRNRITGYDSSKKWKLNIYYLIS